MTDPSDWSALRERLRSQPQDLSTLELVVGRIRDGGLDIDVETDLRKLSEASGRPEHAFVLSEACYWAGDIEGALETLRAGRKGVENRKILNRLGQAIGPRIQDRVRFFQCHLALSFTGKPVIDLGARIPPEFVVGVRPESWTAIAPGLDESLETGIYSERAGGDPLIPLAGSSADIVFSSGLFERVGDFPALLASIFRVLRPEGSVFAEFAPIWSSAAGHHLTGRPRELLRAAGLWPLEPWAHLLYSRRKMRELLSPKLGPEDLRLVERWLYRRPTLNRLFYEDYVTDLHRTPFSIKRCAGLAGQSPDAATLKALERKFPGRGHFDVRGLRLLLQKPERPPAASAQAPSVPSTEEELLVVDATRELLQDTPLDVVKLVGAGSGLGPRAEGRQVYAARLTRQDVILKVHHATWPGSVGCQFAIDVLRRQGVPTARVLAVDPIGRFFGRPTVIQTLEPGKGMDRWIVEDGPTVERRDEVLGQLGSLLAAMHGHSWSGNFGTLSDWGYAKYETWQDYLTRRTFLMQSGKLVRLRDLDAIVRDDYLEAAEKAKLLELIDASLARLALDRPHLLHNDLTLKNVLVKPDEAKVLSILDLNNAIGGDPAYELARFSYFYRDTDYVPAVFRGYGERSAEFRARQDIYLLYVLIEKLHWIVDREAKFPGRREADVALLRQTIGTVETLLS